MTEQQLSSLATFLLVDYPTKRLPYAYLSMALLDRMCLRRTEGLLFWKLGGTGRGLGFSAKPNWNRHALFATWESREMWERFLHDSPVVRRFRNESRELWWVALAPIRTRGAWGGRALFQTSDSEYGNPPVAILTRATIRLKRLMRFWGEVDSVSEALGGAKGLLCSIGFGEVPWIRQATFSIWQSQKDFEAFAYGNERHQRVVQRTRAEGWYAEELFARFRPVDSAGLWNGRNPLEGMIQP